MDISYGLNKLIIYIKSEDNTTEKKTLLLNNLNINNNEGNKITIDMMAENDIDNNNYVWVIVD